MGNGNQTRDFLFVDDLVDLLIKTIHSSVRGKNFNAAGGKEVKVNKIAKLIGGKVVNIPKDLVSPIGH